VGDYTDLGIGQCGIGLDSVDECGAARRGGEQPFQGDYRRPLFGDHVQRAQCVGVGERLSVCKFRPLLQRRQMFRRRDEHHPRRHGQQV
jgi:hypothetical protein